MKRNLMVISSLTLIAFAAGCSSGKSAASAPGPATSMEGSWNVTGSLASGGGSKTYQVSLVSSPCSVTTPVGTFSVQGPVCLVANNNTAQGSIAGSGLPTSPKSTGQGVLIGVASDPVPDKGAFTLVFVSGDQSGDVAEFTGGGTIANGTMTGSGSCSASTPLCQGMSATFSGTH